MRVVDHFQQLELTQALADDVEITVGTNAGEVIFRFHRKRDADPLGIVHTFNFAISMPASEAEQFGARILRRVLVAREELKRMEEPENKP